MAIQRVTYRTKHERGRAVCALLADLKLRSANAVIQEYCELAITLLAAPPEKRAAIDQRVAELVATAEKRRKRFWL